MIFLFPNDEALFFALTAGLVPSTVAAAPARTGRDPAGRPWVAPDQEMPTSVLTALRGIGVEETAVVPPGGRKASHWPEAVPLRRDPTPPAVTAQTPVLFELPDPGGLTGLVGEMLRLGNDRQSVRVVAGSPLLKVVGPPYYTLLRALDRLGPDAPRAYLERAPGLWVEVGWTHPLAGTARPPAGRLLLLRPPHEWKAIADRPFRDVYELLQFELPGRPVAWADAPPAEKLTVPVRFAAAAAEQPADLWVLRGPAVDQIDELVRDADDRLLARLAFAVGRQSDERVAVLRARPGKGGPPPLAFENALACRSYLRLPNLFLPVGKRLRPPLRRDAVRRLLAEDPDQVVWLVPVDGDSFGPRSLPESAFRPLVHWVEYVIDQNAAALSAWVGAAKFEFGSFVGPDLPAPPRPEPAAKPKGAAAAVAAAARTKVAAARLKPPPPTPAPPVEAYSPGPPLPPSELQIRLKAVEEKFLAVDGPLDDPSRLVLWPEIGKLNGLLGQSAEAGLAWANALWETAEPPSAWTRAWVEAERALPESRVTAADLDRLLGNVKPSAPDVRPLAATIAWASRQKPAPPDLVRRLAEVQRYLERHDHLLPVRAVWLAWQGLAHLAGDDVLMLARARDRLLERLLAEGLGAERDLPGFLRFAGRPEGDRLRTVRARAERLRESIRRWFEQNATIKGMYDRTPAYVDLLFAFGMARLGEVTAARGLLRQAAAAIEEVGTEAHTFLLQAFQYRVEQAVAGRPHAGPLPPEQREYLDNMRQEEKQVPIDQTARRSGSYAVERLGKESAVLQPQEKLDPYRRIKLEQDELIRDLVRLTDVHDRGLLAAGVRRLAEQAAKPSRPAETRLRVLTGALELASRVGEAVTAELLAQVVPALDAAGAAPDPRVVENMAFLLERGLFFAAHYDKPDLVRTFADRLGQLLLAPAGRSALDPIGSLVGQTLRSLRKLGLKDQTERLLDQVARAALGGRSLEQTRAAVPGREWQQTLRLLLHLAAGWLYFDKPDQARPILDAARAWILSPTKKLNDPDRPAPQYVALINAYIAAAGHTLLDDALGRIEELFTPGRMDRLPNTMTSNAYYSLLHLAIAEAAVLTLATEDFALGPTARRWLDDDEYLVRRRIHRDVRAALAGAGLG